MTDHGLVPEGVTLTILPGTKVRFKQMWFTSDADDPVNGSAEVSHSIIRWNCTEGLYAERSSPWFEKNLLYRNGYHDIALEQHNSGEVERLPFNDATFDVVYSNNLLECLGDRPAFSRSAPHLAAG